MASTRRPPSVRSSAPGKVLITGGYLVLDRLFTGLVLSVSARFHTTISPLTPAQQQWIRSKQPAQHPSCSASSGASASNARSVCVLVHSPQRCDKPTLYSLKVQRHTESTQPHTEEHAYTGSGATYDISLSKCSSNEDNPFVEFALRYSLTVLSGLMPAAHFEELLAPGFLLHLYGDSQFYSALPPSPLAQAAKSSAIFESVVGLKEELEQKGTKKKKNLDGKTGLGSSAALVSSLVGALFAFFGQLPITAGSSEPSITDNSNVRAYKLAHNVAQLAHCAAQGKVGSGFDISAAFFGSHKYRRFAPTLISPLIELDEKHALSSPVVLEHMLPESWNNEVHKFSLPPGFHLVLGDVKGGSKTPGMVKKVLKWRRDQKQAAEKLFDEIDYENRRVELLFEHLSMLSRGSPLAYQDSITRFSAVKPAQWPKTLAGTRSVSGDEERQAYEERCREVMNDLIQVRQCFLALRSKLRELSSETRVPIEPPSQTDLLDVSMAQPGVLLAGVPGAGGFDAIFAITLSSSAATHLERAWASHSQISRLPVDRDDDGLVVRRLHHAKGNVMQQWLRSML